MDIPQKTAKIIRERLSLMCEKAKKIASDETLVADLAWKDRYIRIGGNGFTPVSLAEESTLNGFGSGPCQNLNTALDRFEKHKASNACDKLERSLQGSLIRLALRNKRSLKDVFVNLPTGINDILFAFDEISLGDKENAIEETYYDDNKRKSALRCDLLCVCELNGQWYPLVVELKYKRIGEDLIRQVCNYVEILSLFRNEVDELLEITTGKNVAGKDILKMVVMPEADTYFTKKGLINANILNTYSLYKEKDVVLVEYPKEFDREGSFLESRVYFGDLHLK